ncbi:MAG: PQQ-dependent dehydrogenase, methanol/ethanol family [Myxococcota bacterium]|nr:PQQ-dependent dehydrogenase, methanol/ethanol family [Myxococcota bacterium]
MRNSLGTLALIAVSVVACREHHKESPAKATPALAGHLALPGEVGNRAEWPMATGDHRNLRFSQLEQISAANVRDLKPVWRFKTHIPRGHEAAPLVVGATMYFVTPYPNAVYAFDLTKGGAVKWKYEAKPSPAAQGVACCDVVNRGAAIADGRLFFNTLDAATIALDTEDGHELWRTPLGNPGIGETMTMAPLVVRDKVLVGNSGGELGVRGWLTALDAADGHVVWRAHSTGPDAEVLIGPEFQPHYAMDRGEDLGVRTWPPGRWQTGGGTVWGFLSYDPALDLVYYGTGNPGPWNSELRLGDNKWTSGMFARKPDTGAAVWFYQFSPHDHFDYDGVNEMVLLDAVVRGEPRSLVVHPDRNGYVYVLDRKTGEVLSATPFAHVTTSRGVDLGSGRYQEVASKTPGLSRTVHEICPASPGAKDWQPSAFSPRTGLLYIPHNNLCQDVEATEANYIAGTPYLGANVKMYAGPGGHRGWFTAWDPLAGRAVWRVAEDFPAWSGALTTAGGLVFYGTMDGTFKALDAQTGKELWRYRAASGVIGQPTSYLGPDGRQYIAVASGVGGWAGSIVTGKLDARDPTASLGFVSAMADLPARTKPGGELLVFGLP